MNSSRFIKKIIHHRNFTIEYLTKNRNLYHLLLLNDDCKCLIAQAVDLGHIDILEWGLAQLPPILPIYNDLFRAVMNVNMDVLLWCAKLPFYVINKDGTVKWIKTRFIDNTLPSKQGIYFPSRTIPNNSTPFDNISPTATLSHLRPRLCTKSSFNFHGGPILPSFNAIGTTRNTSVLDWSCKLPYYHDPSGRTLGGSILSNDESLTSLINAGELEIVKWVSTVPYYTTHDFKLIGGRILPTYLYIKNIVKYNHLHILKYINQRENIVSIGLLRAASRYGLLNILKWGVIQHQLDVATRMGDQLESPSISGREQRLDVATTSGIHPRYELTGVHPKGSGYFYDEYCINAANINGHAHIVNWIKSDQCITTRPMKRSRTGGSGHFGKVPQLTLQ